MSETWTSTRASINRLKAAWREADEDTRWDIGFWATGLGMMAAAIIAQFGWVGALFLTGALIRAVGNHALKRS